MDKIPNDKGNTFGCCWMGTSGVSMHGNAKNNPNLHHLCDIYRKSDRDTFKYGISANPIEEDGYSVRVRDQVAEMNLAAEYDKFGAEILMKDIPGRTEAHLLELEYIDAYFEKYGRNPTENKYLKR